METVENYKKIESRDYGEVCDSLKKSLLANAAKLIVLDDDPTGIQAVHDVCVYTDWSEKSIVSGFRRPETMFYILTNSRAMSELETYALHKEIAARVVKISKELQMDFMLISRADSTLRGHYPLETMTLRQMLEAAGDRQVAGEILVPYFYAGGRFTIQNIHYVKSGEQLIPAGETEFAQDKTFGYNSSNLCDYIEEKTKGAYSAKDVTCISLESLRRCEMEKVTEQLLQVHDFGKVIVNALSKRDLIVFCAALYRAVEKGKFFLFRTAADFVKVFGGITDKELLSKNELITKSNGRGGIVIIGSHTEKTTSQLQELKKNRELCFMEFQSDLVVDNKLDEEVKRVVSWSEECILDGRTAVIYTNRKLLTFADDTKEAALQRSVRISAAVSRLVGDLSVEPAFVVAKGGITSSDIGVKALSVKEAYVLGQIQPGIPVWKTDDASRFPGIPYVIFPGNVGEIDTLKKVVEILL